jgi:hypothetical protein
VSIGDFTSLESDGEIASALESLRSDGVIVIRRALASDAVRRYTDIVSEYHRRFLSGEIQNYSLDDETASELPEVWEDTYTRPRELQSLRKWNAVGIDERFIPLVDAQPHFNLMLSLLGTQLTVTKTQFLVVPSGCIESPYLHTDAGSMADIVPMADSAPIMCSVQFFLTDLGEEMMGNFTCVPRSHLLRFPWEEDNEQHSQIRVGKPQGGDIPMADRVQVCARAGDAVVFLHSLWHGVCENQSVVDRKSIIYSYARSFVRAYDYDQTPESVVDHGTERQRRLFGDLGGWAYRPGCFYHYSDSIRVTIGS